MAKSIELMLPDGMVTLTKDETALLLGVVSNQAKFDLDVAHDQGDDFEDWLKEGYQLVALYNKLNLGAPEPLKEMAIKKKKGRKPCRKKKPLQ